MSSPPKYGEMATHQRPPWIWSQNANVHVAKNLSWFENDYKPVTSYYTDTLGNKLTEIIGIGTVILSTRGSPSSLQPDMNRTVVLKHAVHAPDATYNILGRPLLEDYWITTYNNEQQHSFLTSQSDGQTVAFFKPLGKCVIELELQINTPKPFVEVQPIQLEPLGAIDFQVYWPHNERFKVAAALERYRILSTTTPSPPVTRFWQPYSA